MERQKAPLHFLLRFNDVLRRVDSYAEHKGILDRHGSVWWGKFGAGAAQHVVEQARRQLRAGTATYVYLFQNRTIRFTARLAEIVGGGRARLYPPPTPSLVPRYYRTERLPLWFRLVALDVAAPGVLRSIALYDGPFLPPDLTTMRGLVYVRAGDPRRPASTCHSCPRRARPDRVEPPRPKLVEILDEDA